MMSLVEELSAPLLNQKLAWLNGYLSALGLLNSSNPVGFQCKLFAFALPAGDPDLIQPIQRCLNYHAHQLFNVYPDQADFEWQALPDWQEKLCAVWQTYLRLQAGANNQQIVDNLKLANRHFCQLLQQEFVKPETTVYELKVNLRGRFYRLLGIDLLFEIEDNQLLVLQVLGSD